MVVEEKKMADWVMLTRDEYNQIIDNSYQVVFRANKLKNILLPREVNNFADRVMKFHKDTTDKLKTYTWTTSWHGTEKQIGEVPTKWLVSVKNTSEMHLREIEEIKRAGGIYYVIATFVKGLLYDALRGDLTTLWDAVSRFISIIFNVIKKAMKIVKKVVETTKWLPLIVIGVVGVTGFVLYRVLTKTEFGLEFQRELARVLPARLKGR